MFKLFVIVMLCVIALQSCSADVSIATVNVPLRDYGYIWYSINGWSDMIRVPFNIPVHYWSW